MNPLIFFDKEGNSLNFNYNSDLERYEGDILFHENSSDTYKTQALYLAEKVPSFEYENQPNLTIRKFQLFNERGFNFYNGTDPYQIDSIEPVNTESDYYSKWIYGDKFDSIFKRGTFVRFDSSIFEFTIPSIVYSVVGSKKGAIMILSLQDNDYFSTSNNYTDPTEYIGKTISGVNLIGIYDYVRPPFINRLSYWNEYDFYNRFYQYRKLNIINTQKNDNYGSTLKYDEVGVVTVKDPSINDGVHYEYSLSNISSDLIIEVFTKTDLPLVYTGGLVFNSVENILEFTGTVPILLKSGTEFQVRNSSLNSNFLNVSQIQSFLGNSQLTYYATASQVIWDNRIYQCVQSYTWSGDMVPSITPNYSDYWSDPTYLPIDQVLSAESVTGYVYLTTDHLYFTQSYTQSSDVTLASAAEKFQKEFKFLDIDLYYQSGTIKADLVYSSEYAIVNFYPLSLTYSSIGTYSQFKERLVETYEDLNFELNYEDISENFNYNIVFSDLDEFGFVLTVNGMKYQGEIVWVYSSGQVDMERTIDRTLREWISRNFLSMIALGVIPTLTTIGYVSPYYNCINLRTEYPNVPVDFDLLIGSTGDFIIEKYVVAFYDMGSYMSININGREYGQSFDTNISTTLANWVTEYVDLINDYGIWVRSSASSISFGVKDRDQRVDLVINVGKSSLPGIDLYKISRKMFGNHGCLITSNEVLASDVSQDFETLGFSTGMVFGINETFHPLQNIEFNCLFMDSGIMNMSYEGPFWGLTSSACSTSALTTVSFNVGFGQTACVPAFLPDLYRGMFDNLAYDQSFSVEYYITNTYSVSGFSSYVQNMVDIIYVQTVNSIYVLGDTIGVFDSNTSDFIQDISFPYSNPSRIIFNNIDGYLYAISSDYLLQIDPFINQITSTYSITNPVGISFDGSVGNVYVSFGTSLSIYNSSGFVSSISIASYQMVYNSFEDSMYVVGTGQVRRVGSDFSIVDTHIASGVGAGSSIVYDPENESVYVSSATDIFKIDNGVISTISPSISGIFDMIFNNLSSSIDISTTGGDLISLNVDTDLVDWTSSPGYGYLSLNQFDGSVYVSIQGSSQSAVVDSIDGTILSTIAFTSATDRLTYNVDRNSIWMIQPSSDTIVEIVSNLSGNFIVDNTPTVVDDDFYGSLESGYQKRNHIWLHTREYIRRPRENFTGDPIVHFYWKWYSDNVPAFFLYDFSGDQLPSGGLFDYQGEVPLDSVNLNRNANRDINRVTIPEFQQTIFSVINNELNYIDDSFDVSSVPNPIQIFIGYNSPDEGPLRSVLQLFKKEEIDFIIIPTPLNTFNFISIETVDEDGDRYGRISLDISSSEYFTGRGFKIGQHLAIFVKDISNNKKQYISNNNGYLVKIRSIYSKSIEVDFFKEVDSFSSESNVINDFPKVGSTTYLSFRFKVWDREIGRFNVYGQTEIEDIRYHIELNNIGKLISSDSVYIFKEYDIKEEGIDWVYLNQKRKEMLMMKNLIYPYIGSYKSIINAINYFGYNDLELYEYYRDVNPSSPNYSKLYKVEIPDIFDNTVEGWSENDFIKHTFPNPNYEDTNLFNLTFRITDREGNNILNYTLREVQIKLQGLKYWLQKNIIPISHKILDITGRADFVGVTQINHISKDVSIFNVNQDFSPVTFKLNEAYLMPVNNGSTVYNCVLDLYSGSENLPDSYTIDIRAYEIYREWYPFKNYQIGDRVIYYDKAYESSIINNMTNNPRKFETASDWISSTSYSVSDIVSYDRDIYVYTGQGGVTYSTIAPIVDSSNWLNVTEWKEVDLVPVDTISEWRPISNLMPFNFTIDSNISPYLIISVNSSNGYGMNYSDRKNYEIRGILDIRELEAFSNLTSKQYRYSLPIVITNVPEVVGFLCSSGVMVDFSGEGGLTVNTTTGYYTIQAQSDSSISTFEAGISSPAEGRYCVYASDDAGNPSGIITAFGAIGVVDYDISNLSGLTLTDFELDGIISGPFPAMIVTGGTTTITVRAGSDTTIDVSLVAPQQLSVIDTTASVDDVIINSSIMNYLNIIDTVLTQLSIELITNSLVASGLSSGSLQIFGAGNASPSSASLSDKAILEGLGWVIILPA